MKALVSRKLYTQIMRLYPEPFRAEFSEEMLSMFDECEPALASRHLLQDVFISVARQRIHYLVMPKPATINFYREASSTSKLALIFAISVFLVGAVTIPFAAHPGVDQTEIVRSQRRNWYSRCANHPISVSEKVALRMAEFSRPNGASK